MDLISGILGDNRPRKLTPLEQIRETSARAENSVKVAVAGMKTQNITMNLSRIVRQVVEGQIDLELAGFKTVQGNVQVIFKVPKEKDKWVLLRHSNQFKSRGIYLYNLHTEREREVARWLKQKEREIKEIGISARKVFQGMFINGYKWVWNDLAGMLIKTNESDKYFSCY